MKIIEKSPMARLGRDSALHGLTALLLLLSAGAVLFLAACESEGPSASMGSDGDSDGDTDGDADGDADSDADGDTENDGIGGTDDPGGTDTENPCLGENPPDNCQMVASGPACGDGNLDVDELGEECDDGNTLPGDGCTGICKVEPHWECLTPGGPCELLIVCGNGVIEAGEVCDDGDTIDDNGCNATCDVQSVNYICPEPGEPCIQVVLCGDNRIAGDETCEDGNTESGDGCDADCHREEGWICLVPGEACTPRNVCGDGKLVTADGEACDDGNTESGDGCSGDCYMVEPGYICPEPGRQCVNTMDCGDGLVTGSETCDDANDDADDGCVGCKIQDGYECPFPGAMCLADCGDGVVMSDLGEECDDKNEEDGDGCSSTCEWEDGFVCTGEAPTYSCEPTLCGDGTIEGTEACDDGNTDMGDGCSSLCRFEPECTGGVCTSPCGDGLVVAEECDDGNLIDGDGCSSSCLIEEGSECDQSPIGDTLTVPIVYRDFTTSHPDFEPGVTGSYEATTGLVTDTLDADGKPQYGTAETRVGITSATTFAQWYRDVPGTNDTLFSTLTLYDNGAGGYVNRWGEEGEQWTSYLEVWCAPDKDAELEGPCDYIHNADDCDALRDADELVGCNIHDGAQWGVYVGATYDGNPVFFPLDGLGITPLEEYSYAQIPEDYDVTASWPSDEGSHNFHFTSEVRYWFKYEADQEYALDFTGDDDVWVFVNNRLAVDLGGIHTPVNGSLVLADAADAAVYGMEDGQVYEIKVFQAERQKTSSTYKLTLSGFNSSESDCGPICGDAVMSPGEQCDNGGAENVGGYGKCEPDCTRGPYCGDGIVQDDENPDTGLPYELCDDGKNLAAYNSGTEGCAPGCVLPPYCGDGIVQGAFGEACDDGVNDGSYGGCSDTCELMPWCGDGEAQAEFGELCDDGLNDGTYNTCAPECALPPRCGDGIIQSEWGEQCDGTDDCGTNCKLRGVCGDEFVDENSGEECDDGVNDGGYGECAPDCVLGPHCGDGAVESSVNPDTGLPYELCDDSINDGGYGECAAGCVLGPRCGDGLLQEAYEECDEGEGLNGTTGVLCTAACKNIVIIPI